jgi:hypothetical protein
MSEKEKERIHREIQELSLKIKEALEENDEDYYYYLIEKREILYYLLDEE